jgi:hypothetical protein
MLIKTPLEKALAEVAKCEETVGRWQADAAAKRAELSSLEDRAGDEVLADESAAVRLAEQATRLRSEIDMADRAAAAAARRVVDARRGVLRARAGELRTEAEGLRAEADRRQTKTDRLLADLAEHEGCQYVPYEPVDADVAGAGSHGVPFKLPITHTLRSKADVLDQKAADLDAKANGSPETVEHHAARVKAPAGR